ncbi:MAG: AEC family transporter [Bacteroidales bacterium]|nr:AEC family transporter [Bacteroidales bacterium]
MGITTILHQIIILGILASVGAIAYRFKILEDSAKSVIEKLVFYISLPLLIVSKLSTLSFTPEILRNAGLVVLFAYGIMFIQLLIGKMSARIFHLERRQAVIHSLHHMLGNIVFLGFPLLDALIPGGEALLYAALYQLVLNTILWSYGVIQLNPDTKEKGWKQLKKLINPNTVALSLGLMMMLLKIQFPPLIQKSFSGLGSTTLYLAMLYIGILLAQMKVKEVFKLSIFTYSLTKLLITPLLFLVLIYGMIQYLFVPLNATAFTVLVLESAMPAMTILVLLAKRFGADDSLAMKNFFVSTVLSLLTLPMVLYAVQWIQQI